MTTVSLRYNILTSNFSSSSMPMSLEYSVSREHASHTMLELLGLSFLNEAFLLSTTFGDKNFSTKLEVGLGLAGERRRLERDIGTFSPKSDSPSEESESLNRFREMLGLV